MIVTIRRADLVAKDTCDCVLAFFDGGTALAGTGDVLTIKGWGVLHIAMLAQCDLLRRAWQRKIIPPSAGGDLSGINLGGAGLRAVDLSGTDLTGANLTGADLRSANLRGANLTDADLMGANLSNARMQGANLTGADLSDADLSYARLTGADMTDAWLINTNMTFADLEGVDLTGVDVERVDWLRGDRAAHAEWLRHIKQLAG